MPGEEFGHHEYEIRSRAAGEPDGFGNVEIVKRFSTVIDDVRRSRKGEGDKHVVAVYRIYTRHGSEHTLPGTPRVAIYSDQSGWLRAYLDVHEKEALKGQEFHPHRR